MKQAQRKDFFREIKKSLNRYLSILFIVALGVAFYAGIRSSEPDMQLSADAYFDQTRLMDIRVLGTLGLSEENVAAIEAIDGIAEAEGGYSMDVLSDSEGIVYTVNVFSLCEQMNQMTVKEGRLPKEPGECFMDTALMGAMGLSVGDQITLQSGSEDPLEDSLNRSAYTIVGGGTYSWFLNMDRGTSFVGNGDIDGFIAVLPEAFCLEYYTAAYARTDGLAAAVSYTDGYQDQVDAIRDRIEDIAGEQCEIHFASVKGKAQEKIDEGAKELQDAKKEADEELSDAAREIADAEEELKEGREKLADAENKLADGKREIADGKRELQDARTELAEKMKELQDAKEKLPEAEQELADGRKELEDGREKFAAGMAEWEDGRRQADDGWDAYHKGVSELEKAEELLKTKETELNQGEALLAEQEAQLAEQEAVLRQSQEALDGQRKQVEQGEADLAAAKAGLEKQVEERKQQKEELEEQKEALEGQKAELEQQIRALKEALEAAVDRGNDIDELLHLLREAEAGLQQLEDGLQQTEAGLQELENGLQQLENGLQQLESGPEAAKLAAARKQLNEAQAQLTAGQEQLAAGKIQLEAAKTQTALGREQIKAGWQEINANKEKLSDAKEELDQAEEELAKGRRELEDAARELEEGEQKLADGEKELADAKAEIEDGERQLAEGWETIGENERKLLDAEAELPDAEAEIAKAYEDIDDGEQKLADGKREYEDGKKEAEDKIRDAEEELADAQKTLDDLEEPEWYVLDRNSIQSYVEYGMDAERIGAIGKVFPAIFFLVAALVSLTTMTRMVEDERTLIGTMKALGYGKWSIASKYILYALSASLLGSLLGVFTGSRLLPWVIMTAYGMLYQNLQIMVTPVNLKLALMATGIAVACTTLAAFAACYKELRSAPAQLMRPAAPPKGKRVLLEYVPFIWKRMTFTGKSTIRNLFRYKKRFLMTIFGIGACMALLMVGYGLRDSIQDIVDNQYRTLWIYDAELSIDDGLLPEEQEEGCSRLRNEFPGIGGTLFARVTAMDVGKEGTEKSAYLFVPRESEGLDQFVVLKDRLTGERYQLTDEGVVISEKLSKLLGAGVGDEIYLKEGETDRYPVRITAVSENYLAHYVYLTPALYEQVFGEAPKYNQLYLKLRHGMEAAALEAKLPETAASEAELPGTEEAGIEASAAELPGTETAGIGALEAEVSAKDAPQAEEARVSISEADEVLLTERLLKDEMVESVQLAGELQRTVQDMLKSLDMVIWVLIISAGLLAFVVLYNLNNINITERRRELATLKVLGFYDGEVAAYVYRENIYLTVIGICVGVVLGIILHRYVILTCEIDMMMFGRNIRTMSYVYSVLITALFSLFVNLVMFFRLRKIDMVESLKSVE